MSRILALSLVILFTAVAFVAVPDDGNGGGNDRILLADDGNNGGDDLV